MDLFAIFLGSAVGRGFWPVIGGLAGVLLFYRGFRLLARRRFLLNTPTSKIRSAAIGLVEVCGLARGPYTMIAPITGTACYYYRTIVWQARQSGKDKNWEKVVEENLHVPFYLDDNTGRVLVDPRGAEMEIHRDFREEYGDSFFSSAADVPANIAEFMLRHGVSNDRKTRVEEYCIKPKNALFILGTLAENPGVPVTPNLVRTEDGKSLVFDSNGFHLQVGTASTSASLFSPEIIQLSPKRGPMQASEMTSQGRIAAAMMKAGITNPAAWAVAEVPYPGVNVQTGSVVTTSIQAAETSVEEDGFDMHPKTVLMKGTNNPTFFISWRSQREVVRALGWKSTLMIWGGPMLTLFCLYLLALQFGWLQHF